MGKVQISNKKSNFYIGRILLLLWSWIIITSVQAGQPLWSLEPLTATKVTLPANGMDNVKYKITNNSRKTHTLVMTSIPGITQDTSNLYCSNPFTLAFGQSCTLYLNINGNKMTSDIQGGPVICNSGNSLQCYQPSLENSLDITLANKGNLLFTSKPEQMEVVKVGNNLLLNYTLKNDSSIAQNGIQFIMQGADGLIVRNTAILNNCGTSLPANGSCNLQFQFTAPLTPSQFPIILTALSSHGLQAAASTIINVEAFIFTWQQTNGPLGGTVNRMSSPPGQPSIVYMGTPSGVLKSINAGLNWTPINTGLTNRNILSISAADANTVYAGTSTGGIFKTTNGGVSWIPVNNGITNNQIVTIFAVDANTAYAGSFFNGLFKTTNGGSSWISVNNGLASTFAKFVFAVNANIIYAAMNDGIYKSMDGGANWTIINNGLTNTTIRDLFAVNANVVYTATQGGGIFKTINGGANWTQINNGLPLTLVAIVAVDADIAYTLSGNQIFKTIDGGLNWIQVLNTSSSLSTLLAIDSSTIYSGGQGGLLKTTDGGTNWNPSNNGFIQSNVKSIFALDTNTVYAGTIGLGLFKTINAGNNWIRTNNGLSGNGISSVFALDTNNVFAGDFNSGIFKSSDGGNNWVAINNGLPSLSISSIFAINTNLIFSGTQGFGVFKTTDGG
ncbi:TPA: hypothetical protein ACVEBK_002853, partial [Legionella pneumophila]